MDRFYSADNRDRYRLLADAAINAGERQQIIASLAEDMAKFRRELHMRATGQPAQVEGIALREK